MSRPDPHSYADDTQPALERLHLRARPDFATRTLECEARLEFPRAGVVDLRTGQVTYLCDRRCFWLLVP